MHCVLAALHVEKQSQAKVWISKDRLNLNLPPPDTTLRMQCVIVLVGTHDGVNVPSGDHLSHSMVVFVLKRTVHSFVPK